MAVYTHVDEADLAALLKEYEVGSVVFCKGIAEGSENSNYLLDTDQNRFVLTLYEKRVREKDLPFFLGLMDHLAGRGLPCPVPVQRRDGAQISQIAGRPAALITFLEGISVDHPTVAQCQEAGAALGDFHRLGQDFSQTRENTMSFDEWRRLAATIGTRADGTYEGLSKLLEDELTFLTEAWPQDLPFGVIHADLFPDNMFFLNGKVSGVIDFYFACTDIFAYDLVIMLNAWCFDPTHTLSPPHAQALMEGYRSHRNLTQAELEALPVLARGASLRFLLTRINDWLEHADGTPLRIKDPSEYITKLKFHQTISDARTYGFAP